MTSICDTRQWTYACSAADVPLRGGRTLTIDGIEIALVRSSHGAIFALENRCPHRGGKLSEGIVTENVVICPLHGWKINVITGEAVAPDKGCVHRYPVDLRDGQVFVGLAATPPADGHVPIADITGVHPDNQRPKLGSRRAQRPDFAIYDFDREIPVLAVEPASPDTREAARLQITVGRETVCELPLQALDHFETVDVPVYVTCLMFGFSRPVTWQGVRLADVLARFALSEFNFGSFYSWDTNATAEGERFFETLPREYVLDPRTLLAFGMNGKPLPKEHGGPLRLVVPFLQGYKSVKWLTWIDLTDIDEVGYKKKHGFITFPEFHPHQPR